MVLPAGLGAAPARSPTRHRSRPQFPVVTALYERPTAACILGAYAAVAAVVDNVKWITTRIDGGTGNEAATPRASANRLTSGQEFFIVGGWKLQRVRSRESPHNYSLKMNRFGSTRREPFSVDDIESERSWKRCL